MASFAGMGQPWMAYRPKNRSPPANRAADLLRLGLSRSSAERIPNHRPVNRLSSWSSISASTAQAGFANALLRGYLRESKPHGSAGGSENQPNLASAFLTRMARRAVATALNPALARSDGMEQHPPGLCPNQPAELTRANSCLSGAMKASNTILCGATGSKKTWFRVEIRIRR